MASPDCLPDGTPRRLRACSAQPLPLLVLGSWGGRGGGGVLVEDDSTKDDIGSHWWKPRVSWKYWGSSVFECLPPHHLSHYSYNHMWPNTLPKNRWFFLWFLWCPLFLRPALHRSYFQPSWRLTGVVPHTPPPHPHAPNRTTSWFVAAFVNRASRKILEVAVHTKHGTILICIFIQLF